MTTYLKRNQRNGLCSHQRGGTMLGLVIGALVGLGAALAIAVYITKVPVPFLSKAPARAADSDAAEAAKNKGWNPNAPLAGRAPAAIPAPTPAPVAVPAAPASIEGMPTPESTPVKPKVSSDPLGDLARAKAESRPLVKPASTADSASTEQGIDPFNYFVQAGAFRTPEDAEQQRARLVLMGFQAKVTEREQAGRTVYRVRLGPFDKKDDADRTKEKLEGNSIETALVRVQR